MCSWWYYVIKSCLNVILCVFTVVLCNKIMFKCYFMCVHGGYYVIKSCLNIIVFVFTVVLLPYYQTNFPYMLPHACTVITFYKTNLSYYLSHTCTFTPLLDQCAILFYHTLVCYHIIRLIYNNIYHTLVLLPHYHTNLPYYLPTLFTIHLCYYPITRLI